MSKMKINVQVHHAYINQADEIVQQLKDGGMELQDQVKPIGNFTGIADAEKIEGLKTIPGIASIDVIGENGQPSPDNYTIS